MDRIGYIQNYGCLVERLGWYRPPDDLDIVQELYDSAMAAHGNEGRRLKGSKEVGGYGFRCRECTGCDTRGDGRTSGNYCGRLACELW